MKTNKAIIDNTGRVVIPAEYRRALGVKPGDQVIVILEEKSVRLITAQEAVREARRLLHLPRPGRSLTDELIQERREAAARE
jgi:AbrB family looped-hinge helix DNA binding protein